MLNKCFSMKNSIGHLLNVSNSFYLISVESDKIINVNKIRLLMSIINLIYVVLTITLNLFLFGSSNYLFSLIKFKSMPDQTMIRSFSMACGFSSLLILLIKIDLILG